MRKRNNWNSPIGIALTVAGVVLAVSPEARRTVGRWVSQGTAGILDTVGQVRGRTGGANTPPEDPDEQE